MRTNLIFMTTNTDESVLANGLIPLNTVQRKYGCAVQPTLNGISLTRPGYYKVSGTITFTAPTAGDATVQVQKSNTDVPSITASETITTADTEVRTLPIECIVKVFCNEGFVTLNIVNTGIAITVQNVALVVEYLD